MKTIWTRISPEEHEALIRYASQYTQGNVSEAMRQFMRAGGLSSRKNLDALVKGFEYILERLKEELKTPCNVDNAIPLFRFYALRREIQECYKRAQEANTGLSEDSTYSI